MVMVSLAIVCRFITSLLLVEVVQAMSNIQKTFLRDTAKEMFFHAYNAYMEYAYPADELMPLSCKGRVRGRDPARGDVDDALGRQTIPANGYQLVAFMPLDQIFSNSGRCNGHSGCFGRN
eukprot:m.106224 g.106224  ORF g.106224 m.106224 type:complete len:120 (+) comp37256_c0_seq13:23-382(+)